MKHIKAFHPNYLMEKHPDIFGPESTVHQELKSHLRTAHLNAATIEYFRREHSGSLTVHEGNLVEVVNKALDNARSHIDTHGSTHQTRSFYTQQREYVKNLGYRAR